MSVDLQTKARRATAQAKYDVFLRGGTQILVVLPGASVPPELGAWRRRRWGVRCVSERIREDVRRCGYHRRNVGGREPNRHSEESAIPNEGIRGRLATEL